MFRALLRQIVPEPCGCGWPATKGGFFCDRCRAALLAASEQSNEYDEFAQQHELEAKLNSLSDEEWNSKLCSAGGHGLFRRTPR